MNSKNYEEDGYGHNLDLLHLALFECFVTYVKWVQTFKARFP